METKTIRITNKTTAEKVRQFFADKERIFKKMSEGKASVKSSEKR